MSASVSSAFQVNWGWLLQFVDEKSALQPLQHASTYRISQFRPLLPSSVRQSCKIMVWALWLDRLQDWCVWVKLGWHLGKATAFIIESTIYLVHDLKKLDLHVTCSFELISWWRSMECACYVEEANEANWHPTLSIQSFEVQYRVFISKGVFKLNIKEYMLIVAF